MSSCESDVLNTVIEVTYYKCCVIKNKFCIHFNSVKCHLSIFSSKYCFYGSLRYAEKCNLRILHGHVVSFKSICTKLIWIT